MSLESDVANQWDELREFIMAQSQTPQSAGRVRVKSQEEYLSCKILRPTMRLPLKHCAFRSGGSHWLQPVSCCDRLAEALALARRTQFAVASCLPVSISSAVHGDLLSRSGHRDFPGPNARNVNLWSIYYPSVAHRSHAFGWSISARIIFSKMTGRNWRRTLLPWLFCSSFFQAYLDELNLHLNNQYLLSFAGDGGAKGKYVRDPVKSNFQCEFSHAINAYINPSK